MSYQQITIVGNVGKAPELRYTQSGSAVTDFSLAINTGYTDSQGQRVDRVTWYRVTCWNTLAEVVAQYVKKGKQVLVVADRIEANAYVDRDGNPRASLDVTANTVRFLGSKNDNNDNNDNGAPAYNANNIAPDDGDIPF